MKKRDIAKSIVLPGLEGKCEKAGNGVRKSMKRIAIAFVLLTFTLPINSQVLASDKKIKPGKKQATLILSDGSKIVLNTKSDTIVSSTTKGVRIVVDSTGINYITMDSLKIIQKPKDKPAKKK